MELHKNTCFLMNPPYEFKKRLKKVLHLLHIIYKKELFNYNFKLKLKKVT